MVFCLCAKPQSTFRWTFPRLTMQLDDTNHAARDPFTGELKDTPEARKG